MTGRNTPPYVRFGAVIVLSFDRTFDSKNAEKRINARFLKYHEYFSSPVFMRHLLRK
nr:MAG TPA: hypothetical protein [Bacteriophage sp.]